MRLPEFIARNLEPILADWEAFARSLAPGKSMGRLALRDDAEAILVAALRDMDTDQTLLQQASKSKGHGGAGGEGSDELDEASTLHGVARVGSGFNLVEVVSEYRALRASVLRLWRASLPAADLNDLNDITRFNECMDQSLTHAVAGYTTRVDETRQMFLAILAHDLRNPLNTIALSTQVAAQSGAISGGATKALQQVESSVAAIHRLVSDLIDFAATGLGSAMPLSPAPMDLERLTHEVVCEIQMAHPARRIVTEVLGDAILVGDASRLRQVVSNLLGNAIQHGAPEEPIVVTLGSLGADSSIQLSVRNSGSPIPADVLPNIFDPLVRGRASDQPRQRGSIGLGLYIVREIVAAHHGKVKVTSSAAEGTCFVIRLPRTPPST